MNNRLKAYDFNRFWIIFKSIVIWLFALFCYVGNNSICRYTVTKKYDRYIEPYKTSYFSVYSRLQACILNLGR
jgi:hypothetical protein